MLFLNIHVPHSITNSNRMPKRTSTLTIYIFTNDQAVSIHLHLPRCNFNAKCCIEIVDIHEKGRTAITYLSNNKGILNLHEPPLTKTCIINKEFRKQPLQLSYPNHTQAVGRGVKLTTKAISRKAGQTR